MRCTHKQRGAALLALLLLIVMASAYVLIDSLNARTYQRRLETRTDNALAAAKAALIGWSAAHASIPGKMPCPEDLSLLGFPNEGNAATSCTTTAGRVGRLPWKTLGLGRDFADANGDKLWYAVSSGFGAAPINSDTIPDLTVNATEPAVAVIFSPGPPLSGQDRSILTTGNFLEEENADGALQAFAIKPASAIFNDRGLAISQSDLFSVVEQRIASEVSFALMEYYCGMNNVSPTRTCTAAGGNRHFPRAALFSNPDCLGTAAIPLLCTSDPSAREGRIPANPNILWTDINTTSILRGTAGGGNWFQTNGWRELVYYAVAPKCVEGTTDCVTGASLMVSGQAKNIAVVIAGQSLSGQTRVTKTTLSNYLEDQNASTGDDIFVQLQRTTTFNDVLTTLPQ
jgi:hypothetical protein